MFLQLGTTTCQSLMYSEVKGKKLCNHLGPLHQRAYAGPLATVMRRRPTLPL